MVTAPEPPAAFITLSVVSRPQIAAPDRPAAPDVEAGFWVDVLAGDECPAEQPPIMLPTDNADTMMRIERAQRLPFIRGNLHAPVAGQPAAVRWRRQIG